MASHFLHFLSHGEVSRAIGPYTIQRPTEDRFLMTREELENRQAVRPVVGYLRVHQWAALCLHDRRGADERGVCPQAAANELCRHRRPSRAREGDESD